MLNHIGTRKIMTERLLLRAVKVSDYKDMYIYTQKAEVAKYVTWDVHKCSNETRAVCKMWADQYKSGEKYHWAIVFDGKVIGNIEVVKIIDATAYLGWQLDSTYWNMGIMTEAAAAVRDYMFSQVGVDSLNASFIIENVGSGRVMQKIGMAEITPEKYYEKLGEAKEHNTKIDGLPLGFYSISKSEWLSMQTRQITVDEFDKCSNIWDMKKCPFTEQFRNELSNKIRFIYALEINGKFIAEGALVLSSNESGYTIENQRVYLSRLIVKKENRNIGLGQLMLEFLINKAKEMGYSEISVGVDSDNNNALHIYRKYGFTIFDKCSDKYGDYFKMILKV